MCQASPYQFRDLGACGLDEFGIGVRVPAQGPFALGRAAGSTQVRSAGARRRRQLDDVGELADDRDLPVSNPKLRGSFPAGKTVGVATSAAQQSVRRVQ